MFSPYRIPPSAKTNHTRKQKTPNTNLDDVKLTSNDIKITSNQFKTTSNEPVKSRRNSLKVGANIEINEKYSDEIIHNFYLYKDLAIQMNANVKTLKSVTVLYLKQFNDQSLTTQAKKGEQLVSMMPAFKKSFSLLPDHIIALTIEKDALKDKIDFKGQLSSLEKGYNEFKLQYNKHSVEEIFNSTSCENDYPSTL